MKQILPTDPIKKIFDRVSIFSTATAILEAKKDNSSSKERMAPARNYCAGILVIVTVFIMMSPLASVVVVVVVVVDVFFLGTGTVHFAASGDFGR